MSAATAPGDLLEARLSDRLREFDLDLELRVEPGECAALVGPSGAGKTTALRLLAGLRAPRAGRVAVGGRVWSDPAARVELPPEERSCGFVFQEYALFPHLSARRNVAFGLPGHGHRRAQRAQEMLERFGVGSLGDARPSELSGGERQRVALARALAPRPRLLLLDEPLAALDARTRSHAARELGQTLAEAGVPVVLVTHDFQEAALLADSICVMDRGAVVQRGTASDLSSRPASPFVADFAGASVMRGRASRGEGETLVELEGGGAVHSTDRAEGPVAVSVFPWEISLEPADSAAHGSARNRVRAEVVSVTEVGSRVRVGLACPQPLAAEVTAASVAGLGLRPGTRVAAVWKATATRLIEAQT